MKKAILVLVAAVGLTATATSCGGSASIKTQQDSLAYALGIDMGTVIWERIDSTLNPDVVVRGILDVFAKKTNMTVEQAGQYIQYYMTEVQPKLKAEKNEKEGAEFLAAAEKEAGAKKSETGLVSVVSTEGNGPHAQLGDTVTVHYTLYNSAGKKLQSSLDSGSPLTFANQAGPQGMIAGFVEGVNQLGEGGKSTLYIPYELAYGEQGSGMIEPKQAIKFEIEVVKIVKPTAAPEAK